MSLSFGDMSTEGKTGPPASDFVNAALPFRQCIWMWGLIVPHPGSGNPSGPSLFPCREPVGPACEQWVFFSTN